MSLTGGQRNDVTQLMPQIAAIRQAIDTAIDILVSKKRPLIIFPEGVMTRHNDLVSELMEGPSFIARQAASKTRPTRRCGTLRPNTRSSTMPGIPSR